MIIEAHEGRNAVILDTGKIAFVRRSPGDGVSVCHVDGSFVRYPVHLDRLRGCDALREFVDEHGDVVLVNTDHVMSASPGLDGGTTLVRLVGAGDPLGIRVTLADFSKILGREADVAMGL